MAEIQSQQTANKHAGVKRGKKLSTRVDLTPMVDLGFLLITFFIFTTSLAEPKAMHLAMPQEKNIIDSSKVKEDRVLSLVLKNENTVGYYYGNDVQHMQFTNYGRGLRDVILQKKAALTKQYGKADDLTVLIKPTDNAVYKNVVDALDEMLVTNVTIYMLLDAKPADIAMATR